MEFVEIRCYAIRYNNGEAYEDNYDCCINEFFNTKEEAKARLEEIASEQNSIELELCNQYDQEVSPDSIWRVDTNEFGEPVVIRDSSDEQYYIEKETLKFQKGFKFVQEL